MNYLFEYTTSLQYQVKALQRRVQDFESGEKYTRLQQCLDRTISNYEAELRRKDAEIAKAHRQIIIVRNQWFRVFEDVQKECDSKLQEERKKNESLEKRLLEAERRRDEALDKAKSINEKYCLVASELEDIKERNQKLLAQLNRSFENSSIPSSKSIERKKIPNSREKTDRKPGAQKGHKAHGRKMLEATHSELLKPSEEILNDPDFKKTKNTITKQRIDLHVDLQVTEYTSEIYRNSKTGETYHAPFPEGFKDDVNYGGSIKAFLYLLNNECCTSIEKSRRFLSELTGGKLNISVGMISKLAKVFSEKTEDERRNAFADMLSAPVMHTDCTNARVNGHSASVFICASTDGRMLYFAREKKGIEGVKGTVTEDYQGILVHDHELTFYNYGSSHQECLAHILRALKGSMENEKDRKWNSQMHELLREMIHYRKHLQQNVQPDAVKVAEFEARYSKILTDAKQEYENDPPGIYYRDGFNLYVRMEKFKENHLLFLHDIRVPYTNNLSERGLRKFKRKQVQAVSFRSFENLGYTCDGMSSLALMRLNSRDSFFQRVSHIFD